MPRTPKPWFNRERKAWFVTIAGVRHNLGKDKKLASDEFHRLMRQPQEHRKVSSQSVVALIDGFLEWVQTHRAPDTYEWYRYRLQRFVDLHPNLTVAELRPYHVQKWADGYSHSKTSRRNYLRSVKRCMSWAARLGYIDRSPLELLEVPSGENREVVVSDAEYQRLLELAGHDTLRDLITVTWETGCRPQESLRVEARHVDIENHRWVFPVKESKGKRLPRIVYLTDHAWEITRRLMLKHPEGALFRNSRGGKWKPEAVNCGFDRIQIRMGKELLKQQGLSIPDDEIQEFGQQLSKTRRQDGIELPKTAAELRHEAKRKLTNRKAMSLVPHYSLYALRHSWATHALERGLDSITVAVLMGHRDASMLARVYQHLAHNPKYLLDQAKRALA